MRPRRIEIHIHGQRTCKPNSDCCEEGPARGDVFSSQTEREPQSEEAVQCCCHTRRSYIGAGVTIGGDMPAETVIGKHPNVGDEKKRGPENGRPKPEVVFQVPRLPICLGAE